MPNNEASDLRSSIAHAIVCLRRLAVGLDAESETTARFHEALQALEMLPLTTEEYGLARNRLLNARTYVETGERRAAGYELRLLVGSLKAW